MKTWTQWGLLGLLLAPEFAAGQIDVRCKIEPTIAVQYELIKAVVTIQNNTGEALRFGGKKANCALDFDIFERLDLLAGFQKKNTWQAPALTVAPAARVTFTNYINNIYDLNVVGSFTVQAVVLWKDDRFVSEKTHTDIVAGTEIDRLQTGIPGKKKESRTYSLRLVNRDYVDRLFLRIDDEPNHLCYGVYDLGSVMRIGQPPSLQVDASGNVHVLLKSSPTQYYYAIFSPSGHLVDQKQYAGQSTQMRIQADEQGEIRVKGIEYNQEDNSPFKAIGDTQVR